MGSQALAALEAAVDEVAVLRAAAKTPLVPKALPLQRVLGRAQVVLLCSHFERYIFAVNEEAVAFLLRMSVTAGSIPVSIRILASRKPIDELAATAWENRADKLARFVAEDAWHWSNGLTGTLDHARLIDWMSSPKPKYLVRYFRLWGIEDIFSSITRTNLARSRMWLGVQELVDKRNNIAHGDVTAQATTEDVTRYMRSAKTFCQRADARLRRVLVRLAGGVAPW